MPYDARYRELNAAVFAALRDAETAVGSLGQLLIDSPVRSGRSRDDALAQAMRATTTALADGLASPDSLLRVDALYVLLEKQLFHPASIRWVNRQLTWRQRLRVYLSRLFWAVLGLPCPPYQIMFPRPGLVLDPSITTALKRMALSDPDPEVQALALDQLADHVDWQSCDHDLHRQLARLVLTSTDYLIQQGAYRCLRAHHLRQFHVGHQLGIVPSPFLIDLNYVRQVAEQTDSGHPVAPPVVAGGLPSPIAI